jgi:hypothetical protein
MGPEKLQCPYDTTTLKVILQDIYAKCGYTDAGIIQAV